MKVSAITWTLLVTEIPLAGSIALQLHRSHHHSHRAASLHLLYSQLALPLIFYRFSIAFFGGYEGVSSGLARLAALPPGLDSLQAL